jgi:hypothetical protein
MKNKEKKESVWSKNILGILSISALTRREKLKALGTLFAVVLLAIVIIIIWVLLFDMIIFRGY